MLHTGAWVAWLLAAAVPAFVLRNPLYLALVLGAAWVVYSSLGRSTSIGSSWGSFVRLGLFLFLLTIPFNALSVHVGEIVLFQLPEQWPIVGGPITLEAIIAGAVNGLALFTLLVVFAAFNAVVDHYQLLRATPAFLFQAGVVISIAITFVPQMVLSAKEIRQAQRIRGHHIRGIRDLLPLIMPLLASALERAIQLAETMEARGFGSVAAPTSGRRVLLDQLGTLAGLLMLLFGLFVVAFVGQWSLWGWVLAVTGAAVMLTIFVLQGRRVQRTRYRRTPWTWRDTVVGVASAAVIGVVVTVRQLAPEMVFYLPYPPNPLLPSFNSWIGATLLLLAVPALAAPRVPHVESPTTESVL
ncbi:MAG: energy-coupling factor transporter transmembrane component T [Anaerolineae bacterium]|jgi:energy-coupling factor transport system permease protein